MIEFFLNQINFLLNQFLRLDTELFEQLNQFANRCMQIEIEDLPLPTIYIRFQENQIKLTTQSQEEVEVKLSAKKTAFVDIVINRLRNKTTLPADISIQGNVEFAHDLFNFFAKFEIDWEEQIAKICGDAIASQVGKQVRSFNQYLHHSLDIATQNLREYLEEEVRLLTPRLAVEDFNCEIDNIRIDTDRIEARIKRLEKSLND